MDWTVWAWFGLVWVLHMYLDRESQPLYDGLYENEGLYEDGGLYEDMTCIRIRIRIRIRVMHLRLVHARTHIGDCTYTGLGVSRDQSISQSTIQSNTGVAYMVVHFPGVWLQLG